jgi:hypothetical protein
MFINFKGGLLAGVGEQEYFPEIFFNIERIAA